MAITPHQSPSVVSFAVTRTVDPNLFWGVLYAKRLILRFDFFQSDTDDDSRFRDRSATKVEQLQSSHSRTSADGPKQHFGQALITGPLLKSVEIAGGYRNMQTSVTSPPVTTI